MENTIIKDEKGREIIRINKKGKMAIARYPDMNNDIKDYIIGVYIKITNKDKKEIVDFLNYIGEENEFCS